MEREEDWRSVTLTVLGWVILLGGAPLVIYAGIVSWDWVPAGLTLATVLAMSVPAFRRSLDLRLRGVGCVLGLLGTG
ncbi:MAG TPA: hypothetical protein VN914_17030, partial [Polyangia bacterium]|nr:hypothetical protein [Polyangia bacterium]